MPTRRPAALPVLALGSDQRVEHKRGEETDQRIQEIADSERVQECHNPRPLVSERAHWMSDAQRAKTQSYCSEPIGLARVEGLEEI